MNHRWNHYIQKLVSSDINDNSRNHSLSERNPSGKTDELEEEDILIGRRIVSLLQPSLRKEKTGRGSKKRLSSSFCSVEIVGAHVKIDECPSRIQWIGLYGVVVGETTNTLHVAGYSFCKPNEGQKRQTPLGLDSPQMTDVVDGELKFAFDEDRHDPTSALRVVRVFVLPKRHTKISVIVPVTLKKQDVEDHNKEYIEDGRQQSIVRFVGKHVSVPVVF
jgi:RNase P/RNase MRP subunit p29